MPQTIDVDDERVRDRWSRYIGALGIDAVKRQAESRILLVELGALGVEIAKNLILAGCQELIIWEKEVEKLDFEAEKAKGQFFLPAENATGETSRAYLCKQQLQELNRYVKITIKTSENYSELVEYLNNQDESLKCCVVSENSVTQETLIELNNTCRHNQTCFIFSYVQGLTGSIFTDFGDSFTVLDPYPEEIPNRLIEDITISDDMAVIKLQPANTMGFQ